MASLTEIDGYGTEWTILRKPAPTIEGGPNGRSGRLSVLVPLNDLSRWLGAAAGATETIDLGGGTTMERVLPVSMPGDPEMLLMSYRAEAFGTPGGTGASFLTPMFNYWRVDCEFATLPFDIGGDAAYYTISMDAGVTYETIPGSVLLFPSGKRVTGERGIPVPVVALTLTTFLNPAPIPYSVVSMIGKVNEFAFDDYPAGTLKLEGIRGDYARGAFSRTFTKSFSLLFRPRPWNEVLEDDGTWDVPTLGGTGLPKYDEADLSILKTA